MSISEVLMRSRCRLIVTNAWFGSFSSGVVWRASKDTPTMGVRMVRGGEIEALYNVEWCEKLSVDEMMAVIQHEIEHIVRLHCHRIGTDRDPMLWNVAADAIVNGKERAPHIDKLPRSEEGKCFYLPDDVDDKISTEELYDNFDKNRIKIRVNCPMCGGTGTVGGDQGGEGEDKKKGKGKGKGEEKGEGDGEKGSGGMPCPMCGGKHSAKAGGKTMTGSWLDDHSIWGQSTVSKDEARQIVRDRVQQATKTAGTAPGHLSEAIGELERPIVNWKYVLRQMVGRKAGGHRMTFARRSRRYNHFGVPGQSTHASVPLTVMVDTSGSMSSADIGKVFAEIEAMSQKFKITLIQFDHAVQDCAAYHRNDWRKIKVKGRGGTSFTNVLDWIEEKKMVGEIQLVLTDGYADFGPERPYHVIWAICNSESKPPWGEYIKITKD